jgi:hypothetical protein
MVASCLNRSIPLLSLACRVGRTLSATRRLRFSSRARKTTDMPPCPRKPSIRKSSSRALRTARSASSTIVRSSPGSGRMRPAQTFLARTTIAMVPLRTSTRASRGQDPYRHRARTPLALRTCAASSYQRTVTAAAASRPAAGVRCAKRPCGAARGRDPRHNRTASAPTAQAPYPGRSAPPAAVGSGSSNSPNAMPSFVARFTSYMSASTRAINASGLSGQV